MFVWRYVITLFATNPCGTSSVSDTLLLEFTKTYNEQIFNTLRIYPNPNQGYFNLLAKGNASTKVSVAIQNTLGQTLITRELDFSEGEIETTFDVEKLPAGTYILQFLKDNKKEYLKFNKL